MPAPQPNVGEPTTGSTEAPMAIVLDHTIIPARDKEASARFNRRFARAGTDALRGALSPSPASGVQRHAGKVDSTELRRSRISLPVLKKGTCFSATCMLAHRVRSSAEVAFLFYPRA